MFSLQQFVFYIKPTATITSPRVYNLIYLLVYNSLLLFPYIYEMQDTRTSLTTYGSIKIYNCMFMYKEAQNNHIYISNIINKKYTRFYK